MSLVMQMKTSIPTPRLEGKEVLVGPDPSVCKVKGVMFGARKQFILDTAGEEGMTQILSRLSPKTASYLKTPLASSWIDFESLVELDRAIHETFKAKYHHILILMGAASAELGIGKVYRSLDSEELAGFLEKNALFHNQYQKFGKVKFEKTPKGARMVYSEYPCYSPVFCASAIGYFMESILRHGGQDPTVVETTCQTRGDATCTYEMGWR
jgi:predicted hydrocarbon binding protein